MTFKLYNAPQSTCSQRVRFVFNGKKIPLRRSEAQSLEPAKPDSKLNPNGVRVALDHGRDRDRIRPSSPNISTSCASELPPNLLGAPPALMHFIDGRCRRVPCLLLNLFLSASRR